MAFLQAIGIPERGGDTMWANLYAALDALSPPMQALCRRLSVVHTVSPVIVDAFRARAGDDLADKVAGGVPARRASARAHPPGDRPRCAVRRRRVHDRDRRHARRRERAVPRSFLNRHIENPNFHVRWSWRPGDLAIWDERCTNHRALSDHYPQYRQMRRCTVKGDRPGAANRGVHP